MTLRFDLRSIDDIRDMVHRTVQALVEGQVVCLPTESGYVFAANSLDQTAVSRLCDGTGCDASELVLSLRSSEASYDFLNGPSKIVRRLVSRCWPGPLTIRVACEMDRSAVSGLPKACLDQIVDRKGEIGFRVVDHRVFFLAHRYLAAPLVLAPGNRDLSQPGDKNAPLSTENLTSGWEEYVSLLLDDGPTRYVKHSTIVCVTGNQWELLHQGGD